MKQRPGQPLKLTPAMVAEIKSSYAAVVSNPGQPSTCPTCKQRLTARVAEMLRLCNRFDICMSTLVNVINGGYEKKQKYREMYGAFEDR